MLARRSDAPVARASMTAVNWLLTWSAGYGGDEGGGLGTGLLRGGAHGGIEALLQDRPGRAGKGLVGEARGRVHHGGQLRSGPVGVVHHP